MMPTLSSNHNHQLDRLLEFLNESCSLGFSNYRRALVSQRVQHRLKALQCRSIDEYMNVLKSRPGESQQLYESMVVRVTDFFRDPEEWSVIRHDIVPSLLEKARPDMPVRVWCAGCSSGQEAYSMAI